MKKVLLIIMIVTLIFLVSCYKQKSSLNIDDSCISLYDNISYSDMHLLWYKSKIDSSMNEFERDFIKAKTSQNTTFCFQIQDCKMREFCLESVNYLAAEYSSININNPLERYNCHNSSYASYSTSACVIFRLEKDVGLTPTTNEHIGKCDVIKVDWLKQYCIQRFQRKE